MYIENEMHLDKEKAIRLVGNVGSLEINKEDRNLGIEAKRYMTTWAICIEAKRHMTTWAVKENEKGTRHCQESDI